jgi:hypothetical protein
MPNVKLLKEKILQRGTWKRLVWDTESHCFMVEEELHQALDLG